MSGVCVSFCGSVCLSGCTDKRPPVKMSRTKGQRTKGHREKRPPDIRPPRKTATRKRAKTMQIFINLGLLPDVISLYLFYRVRPNKIQPTELTSAIFQLNRATSPETVMNKQEKHCTPLITLREINRIQYITVS